MCTGRRLQDTTAIVVSDTINDLFRSYCDLNLDMPGNTGLEQRAGVFYVCSECYLYL